MVEGEEAAAAASRSGAVRRGMKKRICLVLDCLCAHDLSERTAELINLQHYVIKEKRLSEREAIVIFYDVVRVVEALHKVATACVCVHVCLCLVEALYEATTATEGFVGERVRCVRACVRAR